MITRNGETKLILDCVLQKLIFILLFILIEVDFCHFDNPNIFLDSIQYERDMRSFILFKCKDISDMGSKRKQTTYTWHEVLIYLT